MAASACGHNAYCPRQETRKAGEWPGKVRLLVEVLLMVVEKLAQTDDWDALVRIHDEQVTFIARNNRLRLCGQSERKEFIVFGVGAV
jgi:hypothetical protein